MPRFRAASSRLLNRFWEVLDADNIILFQAVFGAAFILCGLNGLFISHFQAPLTLKGQMGQTYVALWYGLLVLGPLACLVGKSLHNRLIYAGHLLQITGDVTVALVLLAYITGTVQSEPIGHGGFGAFGGMAFFVSALLFITRDIRRLRAVGKSKG